LGLKGTLGVGGEFAGGCTKIGERCTFLRYLRGLRGPGGALRSAGNLVLPRPAMRRRFAGGRSARLLLLAGFCFHCLDNAANDPNYGHHDNDEDAHPSVVTRVPPGQDQLCQKVAHKNQCTSLPEYRDVLDYSFFFGLAMESLIEVSAMTFFIL
jgi:hypothetical protein